MHLSPAFPTTPDWGPVCCLKGAVSLQALDTSPPQASAVLLLHTQNPEVRPTASTMKCLSMRTEKSGLVLSWSGVQEGQSRECSQPGQEEASYSPQAMTVPAGTM